MISSDVYISLLGGIIVIILILYGITLTKEWKREHDTQHT